MFSGENCTYVISLWKCWLSFRHLQASFFQTGFDNRDHWIFHFGWPWPSLMVTDLWEIKNNSTYFLANFLIGLDESCCLLKLMLGMIKLYSLFPVWMTLALEGHRVTEKLELVQSFCCKFAWSNPLSQTFAMVDYVREVTANKLCIYGEYRSFEHLLFMFLCVFYLFDCLFVCFIWFNQFEYTPVNTTYRLLFPQYTSSLPWVFLFW